MASAYLFHILRNHPYIDGNKRTGAVASIVILMLNGIDFHADEDDLEKIVLFTAEEKTDRATISRFFETNAQIME